MSFEPKVQRTSIKEMDKILFKEGPMGIKDQLVSSIRK
jgi:acyl CoA:acetate/3-ketoacid CoA transferase